VSRTIRLAKLSAPRMARVVLRRRLFRRLDRSRRRRVLWIVAPAGAGKTALVASWIRERKLRHVWLQLDEGDADVASFFHYFAMGVKQPKRTRAGLPVFTPEFLAAPEGFARMFFRAMCARPFPPAVVVLDDYHEVRPDAGLHAALRAGFHELPEGTTVLVLSRTEPPPILAELYVSGSLDVLRVGELTVREHEAFAIARLWGYSPRDRGAVRKIHARTQGWAAGIVILVGGSRSSGSKQADSDREQVLFEYLAQEVLDGCDPETQQVLLETALLPRVDGAQAARLTGVKTAQQILERLLRSGYFVTRQANNYQYHSLFRDFLLGCTERRLSLSRRAEIRQLAARMFEEAGDLDGAVLFYLLGNAWEDAARLIRAHAPMLLLEGRAEAVARWVQAIPENVRMHDPLLLLNLGQALVSQDPQSALRHLEKSFELFSAAGDGPGAYLAWAAVAETLMWTFAPSLDAWIAVFDDLCLRLSDVGGVTIERRVAAVVVGVLSMRQPWHSALPSWEQRALLLALTPGDTYLRLKLGQHLLFHYGGCVNDLAKAKLVADTLRPFALTAQADPSTAISWHVCDAIHHLFLGRVQECLEAVDRGSALAADSGFRVWDGFLIQNRVFAALHTGDLDVAARELQRWEGLRLAGPPIDAAVFHHCALLVARRRGDLQLAREHARICREITATGGSKQAALLLGVSCVLVGPPDTLEFELERILAEARRCRQRCVQATSLLALALIKAGHGDEAGAANFLREGFATARELGTLFFVSLDPAELSECCSLALERGIESQYACELIRAQRLHAGERAREVEAWPWELRIHALGEFAVVRNGQLIPAGRKQQKKPLDMLRFVVAAGARGIRQHLLAEALWPDADGDAAQHALVTTVYRLRGLLGAKDFVVHQGGCVTLDSKSVFVDAWALERILDRLEESRFGNTAIAAGVSRLSDRVRRLYRGSLLADSDEPFIAARRQRLHQRVAHCLSGS
jgi:LuxR family transcriptional regulator, maltose regulon positive regulatory protein